jgi:Xaa-Pro aminopeptidase
LPDPLREQRLAKEGGACGSKTAALLSVGARMTEKIAATQKYLAETKLDGWLLYDFRRSNPIAADFLDLSGFHTRRWFYFIPKSGEPRGLFHRIECHNFDHLLELEAKLGQMLSSVKKVAMEYSPKNAIPYVSRVDAGTVELVRSLGVEVVSSADLVQLFFAVLTPEQYQTHLFAAKALNAIKDKAFALIAERIKAGKTVNEYEVQQLIWHELPKYGLASEGPPIVAINANAANPHYQPTEDIFAPIQKGDLVLIDLWAKKETAGSIYADITWMGYVGDSLPGDIAEIWGVETAARDEAIAFITERIAKGRKVYGCEVDDVVRGVIEKAGYGLNFTHRTGHSIGTEDHGNGVNIDNFETEDKRELIPGVCFSIEPGIYIEGKYGFRTEIDMFIHPGRAEVTTHPVQKEILLLLR